MAIEDKPLRHRACFRIRSLKVQGRTGRVVLPNGTNLLGVARHTPCHGFLPGLAHVTLCSSVRRPGGTWLRELCPPGTPLLPAAIGRPLSRMPVYTRSHESSPQSMMEDVRGGMEFVLQFVQAVDIERNYFSEAKILSPRCGLRICRRRSEVCRDDSWGRLSCFAPAELRRVRRTRLNLHPVFDVAG
jgi:hypothetical protein